MDSFEMPDTLITRKLDAAMQSQRGIVAVACRLGDLTISMPSPARHGEVLWAMDAAGLTPALADQGFLDHRGLYLGRRTAKIVAAQFGQISVDCHNGHPELFSEDLW